MFRLHREGIRIIIISCIIAILLGFAFTYIPNPYRTILILAELVMLFLILYFFRYPDRQLVNPDPRVIVSPADGKVVVIEEVEEKQYLHERRIQISIFMSPLNVHVNWSPFSGEIQEREYYDGKYLVAWHPKSSTENERTTLVIGQGNQRILVKQIAGAVARRIINYLNVGDKVAAGDEMGFIRFGSRVDILVPLDADIQVEMGQKVKGNQTVLARLR